MTWIAIVIGLLTAAACARAGRRRRAARDLAARVLARAGGVMLVALGVTAAGQGAVPAACLAIAAGLACLLDLPVTGVARRVRARRHGTAVGPFPNAT